MSSGGTLLIIRSTFSDNQARSGSAVECGGYGTVNMVNTTIANNVSDPGQGAAVHINSCNTVIDSTTFAGNTPHGVRGQFLDVYPWIVRNTYFGDSCSFDVYCPVSEGGNVDAGMSCCVGLSDFENRPNLVGPLGDHGGYTQTMLPVPPYWPVVDNPGTSSNCQSEDQRGVSRPQDFSGEPSPIACDTGAVELRDEDVVWIFSDGFESNGTSAWSDVVP